MPGRVLIAVVLGLVFFATAGCESETAHSVDVPDRLTLYSLDGREDVAPGSRPAVGETFHGYPVLGKVVVSDARRRRSLIAAFNDGIARNDGKVARCFSPRHGLQVEHAGTITDYVICFECLRYAVHRGDKEETLPIARTPLPEFNEELRRAEITLAPMGQEESR